MLVANLQLLHVILCRLGDIKPIYKGRSQALHRGAFCQFTFRWIYSAIVVNPPESILAKRTSVHWPKPVG